jgi:hypothetical protein
LLENIGPSSPVQAVRVAQSQIHTFRFEELFVYLCVHGAGHAWARLNWLADVAALLSTRGDRDLEALYRGAQKAGAGRCVGQAMLLCTRSLGFELPASLDQELRQCAIHCSRPWHSRRCSMEVRRPSCTGRSEGITVSFELFARRQLALCALRTSLASALWRGSFGPQTAELAELALPNILPANVGLASINVCPSSGPLIHSGLVKTNMITPS